MGETGPEWHLLHTIQRGPNIRSFDPFMPNRHAAQRAVDNQRKANPETTIMVVESKATRGKFNLIDLNGRKWPAVQCVDPAMTGMLKAGDAVVVRFDRVKKNIPYIRDIAPVSRVLEQPTEVPPEPSLTVAEWFQSLGSCCLHPFAHDCYRPDSNASPLTVWSGVGGHFNDFPVLLDKDVGPVLCFALRKLDNSNWDKVRVVIPQSADSELTYECDWVDPDTDYGTFVAGFNAISPDAVIVFLSEYNRGYCWRKRGAVLEKLTLVGKMTNHGPYLANMSDQGVLCFPNYSKQLSGIVSYNVEVNIEPGAPSIISNTEGSSTDKIQFYDLDDESPTLSATDFDPASLFFDVTNPVVGSYISNLPFDSAGNLTVWATGKQAFNPDSSGFEKSASINFDLHGFTHHPTLPLLNYQNASFAWGKKLVAILGSVTTTGSIGWRHIIEVNPEDPIENSELIDPFDTVFSTQTSSNVFTAANQEAEDDPAIGGAGLTWRPYSSVTYSGICPPGRLTTNRYIYPGWGSGSGLYAFSIGATGVEGTYDPEDPYAETGVRYSYGHFNIPRYDHFKDVQIELLPRGRNLEVPDKLNETVDPDQTKNLNWKVFENWSGKTSQSVGAVTIKRSDNSRYFSYTAPRQCYFGGISTLNGIITELKNTGPYAFPEIIYDRITQTDRIFPYSGDPYLLEIDFLVYPRWTNGGGAAYYGLGTENYFYDGPSGAVECFLVRSQSYLSKRFLRKVNSNGVLVWEKDMSQMLAGAEHWKTKHDLGVEPATDELVGAVSATTLPMGDDMGPPRPAGRVVFQWVDFHTLGPNFLPTQKLCIYDDANGNLLHTLDLTTADNEEGPEEILPTDTRMPGDPIYRSNTFYGDASTEDFYLSEHAESLDYVQVNGDTVDAVLSGDGLYVTISPPPDDGAEIYVSFISGYALGDILFRAGNRRWDPIVREIYVGVDPNELEWALVSIALYDRSSSAEGSYVDRNLRIKMGSNITVAPSIDWEGSIVTSNQAISGGSIYRLNSNGGANSILRKTNPSTI